MKSMTGFGKASASDNGKELTIELKSVNNRFLEVNSRLPKAYGGIEDIINKAIQRQVKRGSVDVYVTYADRSGAPKPIDVDLSLVGGYLNASSKVKAQYPEIVDDFNLTALLKMPEVLRPAVDNEYAEVLKSLAVDCAESAALELDKMRVIEGKSIENDLLTIIENIKTTMNEVVTRAPVIVSEYRTKITNRIAEILDGVEVDESRLINEVAFFADKSDINEEISRMNAHIVQFLEIMSKDESVGRKLDFLSQEMVREANTMCSKSNDITMTGFLVELKNQVEKLKEQIRNVE